MEFDFFTILTNTKKEVSIKTGQSIINIDLSEAAKLFSNRLISIQQRNALLDRAFRRFVSHHVQQLTYKDRVRFRFWLNNQSEFVKGVLSSQTLKK